MDTAQVGRAAHKPIDDDGGGSGKSKQKIIQRFFHTNYPCQHERVIEFAEVNCSYRFEVSKTQKSWNE